jgi:hypothetical protein
MAERTESEMLSRSPLKAQLGGKTYELKILTILKAQAWREAMFKEAADAIAVLSTEVVDMPILISGLNTVLLRFPEKLLGLLFTYAPDLPREEIENSATEEELAIVLSAVMKVAFPFGPILKAMQSAVQLAAAASPSRKYSN